MLKKGIFSTILKNLESIKYFMIIRTVEVQLLYWDGQFVKSLPSFLSKYTLITLAQMVNNPR
jgi:hypothetical protein